jgi:Ras-related protein Rab-11B
VYDISNADSFKNCIYWLENIKTYADENVVIALVGNKTDVLHVNPNKREVPLEKAEKFARENNLIFVGESSALSNQNIKEVMDAVLERIFLV